MHLKWFASTPERVCVKRKPWTWRVHWRATLCIPCRGPCGLWPGVKLKPRVDGLISKRGRCTTWVSKQGRAIANLELAWRPPEPGFGGMDLVWGRWEMQDLRLSYNRLPDARLVQAMQAFGQMYNYLSKRLSRMPSGYVQETRERVVRARRMSVWSQFITEEQTPT